MTEIIDRIAAALAQIEDVEFVREYHRLGAIAALKAIRQPTEAMVKAASDYRIEQASTGLGCMPNDVWQAMIDAALSGDKP